MKEKVNEAIEQFILKKKKYIYIIFINFFFIKKEIEINLKHGVLEV